MAILLKKEEEVQVLKRINAQLNKYLPAEYRQAHEDLAVLRNIIRNYSGGYESITKCLIETEVYNFYNIY